MSIIAEAALSAFIQVLFDKFTSPDLLKFLRQEQVQDELQKWEGMLQKVHAVLEDAEEKQMTSRFVKIWLDDLRDLTYDADDILDEFGTEALRRKLNAESQPSLSKVRKILIPVCCTDLSPRAVTFNVKMGSQIKEITAGFQKIVTQKSHLDLRECATGGRTNRARATRLPTTSLVNEAHVYGRDEDKKAIVKLLLSGESQSSDVHPSVIPILGMGGVGKTTLAQLIYSDDEVNRYFDLKAWICVSDDFDVVRMTKAVLLSVTFGSSDVVGSDLNLLQVKLKEKLSGKKFLLILDDVWNENYDDWTQLRSPFEGGARGSKIVATTRNKGVSLTMGTIPAYTLKELPSDACLRIFTQHALGATDFSAHPELEVIGRQILKKCKHLPLAAKTLGGLLRTKQSHDEWNYVLNSEIWAIPEEISGIIPALRLSYQHLPSHLKRCFTYCSIFPKDYEFEVKELVLLWVSEGLIQQPEENKQIEDLGCEYFLDLHSRSFFQQSSSNNSRFVMHDLINDLAQWVAKELCFRLEDESGVFKQSKISAKASHSSYIRRRYDGITKFEALYKVKSLRTFLPLPEQDDCYLTSSVPFHLLLHLKHLRVLSLSGYNIVELPNSIGDMKHLRYLNLSYTKIKSLPESTSSLYNLQTLILKGCSYLAQLPAKIVSLISLRHLDITEVPLIKDMPVGINELKSLQTLSNFVVGKYSGSRVGDLMNLKFLRGTLCISRLENVIDVRDASNANLNGKKNLGSLFLKWSSMFDDSQDVRVAIDVLDMLRPHISLKELTIDCYPGTKFPTWLGDPSFSNMVLLKIESCAKCTSLPPLGQLPSLKDLSIKRMVGVRSVGSEFYGEGSLKPFQSLEKLCFENMQEWQDWISYIIEFEEFLCLRELSLSQCPKLHGKLPNLPSLEKIFIDGCECLVVSTSNLPMLGELKIKGCKGVVHRSMEESSLLKNVVLSEISELKSLTGEFIQGLGKAKYLKIDSCKELTSLLQDKVGTPQQLTSAANSAEDGCLNVNSSIASVQEEHQQLGVPCRLEKLSPSLHSLTSLRRLEIVGCPKLISFPDTSLPSTLRELIVQNCGALKSLHEAIMCNKTAFLESLEIDGCASLTFMVKGQLPPTLKRLSIRNCMNLQRVVDEGEGGSSSSSLMHEGDIIIINNNNKSLLEYLLIDSCPSLKFLSSRGDIDLPSTLKYLDIFQWSELTSLSLPVDLKFLRIHDCPKLESIGDSLHNNTSLEKLQIWDCEKLKSLPEGLHNLCHLSKIFIWGCSSLVSFPNGGLLPTKLRELSIWSCERLQTLPNRIYNLTCLQVLTIERCPGIISFPEEGFPSSLIKLEIEDLKICKPLFEWGLHRLASLRRLIIRGGCPDWVSFPQEEDGRMMMMLPTSLIDLTIRDFPNLEFLSSNVFQDLSTLEYLHIWNCPKLTTLPHKGLPSSLLRLRVNNCPLLKKHCKKDKGQEWFKIAHIPCVKIDNKFVYDPEEEEQQQ